MKTALGLVQDKFVAPADEDADGPAHISDPAYLNQLRPACIHFFNQFRARQILGREMIQTCYRPTTKRLAHKLNLFSLDVIYRQNLQLLKEVLRKVR